ncbi:uncharacterized protein B0H18DRAFT_554290 [Fomitopsis serialis]|uniref:uncharacterized protein n=1 Tax=Fomitopsis serialis TaxID=139415 RepID=UPI00200825D2|nr:uncharacterized protein B0H18DRAFT_554290 [Neoantrodia serialis]KAH9934318.1 hypothetical protein B0H18DRAFT_554290 [Neoantrodia serialis]
MVRLGRTIPGCCTCFCIGTAISSLGATSHLAPPHTEYEQAVRWAYTKYITPLVKNIYTTALVAGRVVSSDKSCWILFNAMPQLMGIIPTLVAKIGFTRKDDHCSTQTRHTYSIAFTLSYLGEDLARPTVIACSVTALYSPPSAA